MRKPNTDQVREDQEELDQTMTKQGFRSDSSHTGRDADLDAHDAAATATRHERGHFLHREDRVQICSCNWEAGANEQASPQTVKFNETMG